MKKSSKDFKETLKTRQKTVFCKGKIKNKSPNVRERNRKYLQKFYEKSRKDIPRNIDNTFESYFCNRKHETIALMWERKSKISAMLYENILKISKEPLKARSITAFATDKSKQAT